VPSTLHESLADLVDCEPFVVMLGERLGAALPSAPIIASDAEVPQHVPPSLRCDRVLEVGTGDDRIGIVVEIQLDRDPDKSWIWPYYYAHVRQRLRTRVLFVVITNDTGVARWAAHCVDFAVDGMMFSPIVLGPETMARIVDEGVARRSPEVAMLSTLIHAGQGGREDDVALARAAAAAISTMPRDRGIFFRQLLTLYLADEAKAILEARSPMFEDHEITYPPLRRIVDRSKEEGRAQGKAEGKAESILAVLAARGLRATAVQQAAILGCCDVAQLDAWLLAAVTVDSVDALLQR